VIESISAVWVDYIRWNLIWVFLAGLLLVGAFNRDKWSALLEASRRRNLRDSLRPFGDRSIAVLSARVRVLLPEITWLVGFGLIVTALDIILVGS